MDIHSGRKPVAGGAVPRKRCSFASKDTADSRRQDAEFCNRIGCNGRLKYGKNPLFGFTGKPKLSRPSSCSLTSNGRNSSSSVTSKTEDEHISQQASRRGSSSSLGADFQQSSKVQCQLDDNGFSSSPTVTGFKPKAKRATSRNATLAEVGRSNVASSSKSASAFGRKPASGSPSAVSASASSTMFPSSGLAMRKNYKAIRYGLRDPRGNSSESVPGAGLKSESGIGRKHFIKDTSPEGERSSSSVERRSKRTVKSEDGPYFRSSTGVTLSSSRHTRNLSSVNDCSFTSARTRRSTISQSRMKSSNRDNLRASSLAESTVVMRQSPQLHTPIAARVNSESVESSAEAFSSVSGHNISDGSSQNVPMTTSFVSVEQVVSHRLRRYNLDGIAEILMSLERIGEEAELTYEQLVSSQSNLFLGSFYQYDRHRDMRLDIDNMSYEELLALEERMGNVSTALSEEALSECVTRSIYQITSAQAGFSSCNENKEDVKCSVCQEEFVIGEEIGKLGCGHRYHAGCIEQWLRLKNWCPICKGSAAPSV